MTQKQSELKTEFEFCAYSRKKKKNRMLWNLKLEHIKKPVLQVV